MLGNLKEAKRLIHQQEQPQGTLGTVNLMMRLSEPLSTPPLDIPHDILALISVQLWKRSLVESGERALQLLEGLPDKIRQDRKVDEALRLTKSRLAGAVRAGTDVVEAKDHNNAIVARSVQTTVVSAGPSNIEVGKQPLSVAIWTGPAWEAWSPDSLKSGIGGSETAAIHVAAELARRGHKVWLLGMHDGFAGDVEYVHHDRALKSDGPWKKVDVFIASRQPLVLLDGGFSWKVAYVWCHDIHCGASTAVKTALLKADAVLALSRWHKRHLHDTYHFLGDQNVIVTRNGIATGRFGRKPNKQGNKLIYTSSPDRGVERLLELFGRIRAEVSNAELEIYYGFETWRAMCQGYGDAKGLDKIAYYENLLIKNAPPGVRYMGRVGQQQLADAYLKAKIWAYSTWFSETSCISAMEAQAGGCVPVTSALAALEETVQHGFLIRGADSTKEYGDAFVSTCVKLLKDLGWDLLAQEWESMFLSAVARKGQSKQSKIVLPAYAGL
jgi:glycosyltransferase involved in cell wall biosynthesis